MFTSVRNRKELRNLAMALDCLVKGDVAAAADTLVQRFQSVELAQSMGNWAFARHLELVPDEEISIRSQRELRNVTRAEREEIKTKHMLAQVRNPRALTSG